MGKFSKALRHLDVDKIKRKRIEEAAALKLKEEKSEEEKKYITSAMKKVKYDWRSETDSGADLREGMTTAAVMTQTYDSEGESNLAIIGTTDANSFGDPTSDTFSNGLRNTSLQPNGTGSGENGGFAIGDHLAFRGGSDSQPRWAVLKTIDSSKFTTMVISAIRGNDSNGGEDPDESGEELQVWYYDAAADDWRPLDTSPAGVTDGSISKTIIPLGSGTGTLRDWSIEIPEYARLEDARYMLYQAIHSGAEFDHYGITNVRYRRTTPINVVVSLDSPEATSFVRVGPVTEKRGSPKKRKKKVEDMLKAGKEYTEVHLGKDFPGSGTELDPAKPSPIGKDGVEKAHRDAGTLSQQLKAALGKDAKDHTTIAKKLDNQYPHKPSKSSDWIITGGNDPWEDARERADFNKWKAALKIAYEKGEETFEFTTMHGDKITSYTDWERDWLKNEGHPTYGKIDIGKGADRIKWELEQRRKTYPSYTGDNKVVDAVKDVVKDKWLEVDQTEQVEFKTWNTLNPEEQESRIENIKQGVSEGKTKLIVKEIVKQTDLSNTDKLQDLGKVAETVALNQPSELPQVIDNISNVATEESASLKDKFVGAIDAIRDWKGIDGKGPTIGEKFDAVGDFVNGFGDAFTVLDQMSSAVSNAAKNGDIIDGQIRDGAVGSASNPVNTKVSNSTAEDILRGVNIAKLFTDPSQLSNLVTNLSLAPTDGNIGAKGIHNGLSNHNISNIRFNENGDLIIPDTYAFRPHGHTDSDKWTGKVSNLVGNVVGAVAGEEAKQSAINDMGTLFDQSIGVIFNAAEMIQNTNPVNMISKIMSGDIKGVSDLIYNPLQTGGYVPGWKDPAVEFQTVIPKKQILAVLEKARTKAGDPLDYKIVDGKVVSDNVDAIAFIKDEGYLGTLGDIKSLPDEEKKKVAESMGIWDKTGWVTNSNIASDITLSKYPMDSEVWIADLPHWIVDAERKEDGTIWGVATGSNDYGRLTPATPERMNMDVYGFKLKDIGAAPESEGWTFTRSEQIDDITPGKWVPQGWPDPDTQSDQYYEFDVEVKDKSNPTPQEIQSLEKEAEGVIKKEDQKQVNEIEKESTLSSQEKQGKTAEEIAKEEQQRKEDVEKSKNDSYASDIEKSLSNISGNARGANKFLDVIQNVVLRGAHVLSMIGGTGGWGKMSNDISIARSVFSGRVTNHIPMPSEIRDFKNVLDKTFNYERGSSMYIPISSERVEYADDNIYVRGGRVYENDGSYISLADKSYTSSGRGLGGHGQGYAQMIIPPDGSEPKVVYFDYNYHNLNSSDKGEVPSAFQNIASQLTHVAGKLRGNVLTGKLGDVIGKMATDWKGLMNDLKTQSSMPGWPPGIHGAALTEFEVPLSELSEKTQKMIAAHPLNWTKERVSNMSEDQLYDSYDNVDWNDPQTDRIYDEILKDHPVLKDAEDRAMALWDEQQRLTRTEVPDLAKEIETIRNTPEYDAASNAAWEYYDGLEDMGWEDAKIAEESIPYPDGSNSMDGWPDHDEMMDNDPEIQRTEKIWKDASHQCFEVAWPVLERAYDNYFALADTLPIKNGMVIGTPEQIDRLRSLESKIHEAAVPHRKAESAWEIANANYDTARQVVWDAFVTEQDQWVEVWDKRQEARREIFDVYDELKKEALVLIDNTSMVIEGTMDPAKWIDVYDDNGNWKEQVAFFGIGELVNGGDFTNPMTGEYFPGMRTLTKPVYDKQKELVSRLDEMEDEEYSLYDLMGRHTRAFDNDFLPAIMDYQFGKTYRSIPKESWTPKPGRRRSKPKPKPTRKDQLGGVDYTFQPSTSKPKSKKKDKKWWKFWDEYEPEINITRRSNRLMEKKSFQQFKNYKGKPSPDGFPENDPAELGPDGFHPQYGKTAENRYNKLDPSSAKAMPKTGNAKIDAAVDKAKKQPK